MWHHLLLLQNARAFPLLRLLRGDFFPYKTDSGYYRALTSHK